MHEVIVLEDRCVARGDAACHLVARAHDQWRGDRADDLRFFARAPLKDALDISLQTAIEAWKVAEEKIRRLRPARSQLVRLRRRAEPPRSR